MKNIHIILTYKPSRICKYKNEFHFVIDGVFNLNREKYNIYITSDEEIKEGDIVKIPCGIGKVKESNWKYGNDFPSYIVEDIFTYKLRYGQKEGTLELNSFRYEDVKKIILTTDQDLIKDGVQAIDDEFLEWFVKNPSCEYVEVKKDNHLFCKHCDTLHSTFGDGVNCDVCRRESNPYSKILGYKIIIPKEEPKGSVIKTEEDAKIFIEALENTPKPNEKLKKAFKDFHKQETLEKAALSYSTDMSGTNYKELEKAFTKGAKWQQERSYSEEEVHEIILSYQNNVKNSPNHITYNEWFEQFKKK